MRLVASSRHHETMRVRISRSHLLFVLRALFSLTLLSLRDSFTLKFILHLDLLRVMIICVKSGIFLFF